MHKEVVLQCLSILSKYTKYHITLAGRESSCLERIFEYHIDGHEYSVVERDTSTEMEVLSFASRIEDLRIRSIIPTSINLKLVTCSGTIKENCTYDLNNDISLINVLNRYIHMNITYALQSSTSVFVATCIDNKYFIPRRSNGTYTLSLLNWNTLFSKLKKPQLVGISVSKKMSNINSYIKLHKNTACRSNLDFRLLRGEIPV